MIIYRLARAQFKNDLSGKGAEVAGGRWNSIGVPMLYTAESRALCALEIAVHTPLNVVPVDYFMATLYIPDTIAITEIRPDKLPVHWNAFPASKQTQNLGNNFLKECKFLAMRVPSAIVPGDHNILFNPNHPDFKTLKIVTIDPFEFDQRLFIKPAIA